MSRSIKKGPFVDMRLLDRVRQIQKEDSKKFIKTWSRQSMVVPEMVGFTFSVHNGIKFIPVYVKESYVGHKLGEFSLTRTFKGHSGNKKK